jgi:hypothetical protein
LDEHDDGADDLAGHSEAFKIDPISQFEIERLIPIHIGNLDASFTNAAVSMGLAVLLASARAGAGPGPVDGRNSL